LKRFNAKELFELVVLKALIRGGKGDALQQRLYTLSYRSLLKVKQVMENHVQVKEASLLRHRPPSFYNENQHGRPLKQNHSSSKNKRSRKNYNGSTLRNLVYLRTYNSLEWK
jgi:hypothetical protein